MPRLSPTGLSSILSYIKSWVISKIPTKNSELTNDSGYITSSGNAANVTGTVAIGHGGTGATTRLGAVQNLTNENVGTSTEYFLTITTNWGKAGYCSVANAKSVLGVPTKVSQLTNDSGYLTSHQSLSNYSTLANTVKSLSISGKTITVTPGSGSAYTLTTQDTTYSAGTNLSLSGTTFNVSSTPSFTNITISGYTITVD